MSSSPYAAFLKAELAHVRKNPNLLVSAKWWADHASSHSAGRRKMAREVALFFGLDITEYINLTPTDRGSAIAALWDEWREMGEDPGPPRRDR